MLSLQALLCSPEPSDPQDAQVARMYLNDKTEFDRTAKYWVTMYASPKAEESSHEEAIAKVMERHMQKDYFRIEKLIINLQKRHTSYTKRYTNQKQN